MRCRAAFTLLEVLLAVVLLDVGLLALVAGSTVLVAQTNELRGRSTALQLAHDRLQLLGGAPCVATTGDASGPSASSEHWQLTLIGSATRELSDSVSFVMHGVTRSVVLRTRLPC